MFKYGDIQGADKPQSPQISAYVGSLVEGGTFNKIDAIIDTASSMTCVPQTVIDRIEKETSLLYEEIFFRNASGEPLKGKAYIVNLKISSCHFLHHKVLALEKEYCLIGRDILNRYKLLFDGPNGYWMGM